MFYNIFSKKSNEKRPKNHFLLAALPAADSQMTTSFSIMQPMKGCAAGGQHELPYEKMAILSDFLKAYVDVLYHCFKSRGSYKPYLHHLYCPRFCHSMNISYILYMRFLLRITLALMTIFFIGCQGSLFQVRWSSRGGGHSGIRLREYEMRVTAYCACEKCCGKNSDKTTASGHKIKRGDKFVAADERYPFGTEIIVPGYNNSEPVKVLDRGYVIRGNRLDVFFDSHREAREWGVKYLPVKVLTN